VAWCSGRNRHAAIVRRVPRGLKPSLFCRLYGTAEAAPLTILEFQLRRE
jgi:hypothetical protein